MALCDPHGRRIDYLRISITDRCNLRCGYCAPVEAFSYLPPEQILTFEEINRLVRVAVPMGIRKVRITGGEPLIRKDILVLVNLLSRIQGIQDLAMTTNGVLLRKFAGRLKKGGLHRVNVSLDTLDPGRFADITRGGTLRRVLEGLEAARDAGLSPIKLNCVVRESSDEPDARQVAAFAEEQGYPIRFIRQMDMETGDFWVVDGGTGGDCSQCSRLRVTADGMIRPCLFSDLAISLREHGPEDAIRRAIAAKPARGGTRKDHDFHSIGG